MKHEIKKDLLKMLKKDMKSMMMQDKKPIMERMMPKINDMVDGDEMQKVTVMSDSEEGLEKGLSKAQEIMKAKLSKKDK